MSATVAAALKKIAVYILTDKKALKTVVEIVIGIIIIIIMPIVAVVSIFNSNIAIDTDRLQTMVVQNLSAEEKSKLPMIVCTALCCLINQEMMVFLFTARDMIMPVTAHTFRMHGSLQFLINILRSTTLLNE